MKCINDNDTRFSMIARIWAAKMNVSEAVNSRRSVRAFLDQPVDLALVRAILERAARAPSGGNLQPWHVHLVHGARMAELKQLMAERVETDPRGEGAEYPIYPPDLCSPYAERRFAVGEAMYDQLGIARDDRIGRLTWLKQNFQFFGAPVGLFMFVNRQAGSAQWSDLGMFLQTVMLLLREAGLDSCAQEAWSLYHRTIGGFLSAPDEHMLFCGMSIGYADQEHPANRLRTERASTAEYLTIHG